MADERPDFFTLLGLDPDGVWDEGLYRRRRSEIRSRLSQESSGFSSSPRTIEAKRKMAYLNDISVMDSEDGREKERARARAGRRVELERRRKELEEALRLNLAKGHLLKTEQDTLLAEYDDVLQQDATLRRRLRDAEIRVPSSAAEPLLDTQVERQLRSNLAAAAALSLYDVLREADETINQFSPLSRLRAAAETLESRAHLTKNKSDPRIAAWERLAGYARTIFGTSESRTRYDRFMRREAVQRVLDRFEKRLKVAAAITPEQVEIYFVEVRESGVDDLELARDQLVERFRRLSWPVGLPTAEAGRRVEQRTQCPYCAALNEPGARVCGTCGFVLDDPCPSCGRVEPRYGGCGCGFPIGQRDRVERLLTDARIAADQHDLHHADHLLQSAERIWRLPAGRVDRLAGDIARLRDGLTGIRDDLESASRRIDALLRARRFVTAERELRQAPFALPRRELLLAEAEREVRQATAVSRRAREPGLPRARRAELLAEALRMCDDMDTARAELAALPPAPPTNVRAAIDDPAGGALITWDPSAEPDVGYVVIRQTGGQPPRSAEQSSTRHCLGPVTTTSLRDRDAGEMPGATLHYAVAADRLGTLSELVAAEPVVVTTEAVVTVTNGTSGEILLAWDLPERAIGVTVTRAQVGDVAAPVPMPPTEPGRLVDTEVVDGSRYRYTVRVRYERPGGGTCLSHGTSHEITAVLPPRLPGPLSVIPVESMFITLPRVQLRWPDPDRGTVRVVRQTGAGTLREGDRCTVAELPRAGHVLDGPSPAIDRWIDPSMTCCTYVPVLVLDGFGYVGPPRRFAVAPDVTSVTVEFSGRLTRLGWEWPANAAGLAIGFDAGGPPSDPTVAAGRRVVYRNGAEKSGEVTLPLDSADTHVVFGTVVRHGNAEFVSTGAAMLIRRPQSTVRYDVRGGRRRSNELVLESSEPVRLPALVLRGRVDGAPRSRRDGQVMCRIEPMRLDGRHVVSLPRPHTEMSYRLFTDSPADGAAVSLEHR